MTDRTPQQKSTIELTNAPPSESQRKNLPLVRTPAKGKISGIFTCEDLYGCYVHVMPPTRPCSGDDCDVCQENTRARVWRCWLTFWSPTDAQHQLVEFTDTAAESLIAYKQQWGNLLGCMFESSRPSGRENGRVVIRTKRWTRPNDEIRLAPCTVAEALAVIWRLDELTASRQETSAAVDSPKASRPRPQSNGRDTRTPGQLAIDAAMGQNNVLATAFKERWSQEQLSARQDEITRTVLLEHPELFPDADSLGMRLVHDAHANLARRAAKERWSDDRLQQEITANERSIRTRFADLFDPEPASAPSADATCNGAAS